MDHFQSNQFETTSFESFHDFTNKPAMNTIWLNALEVVNSTEITTIEYYHTLTIIYVRSLTDISYTEDREIIEAIVERRSKKIWRRLEIRDYIIERQTSNHFVSFLLLFTQVMWGGPVGPSLAPYIIQSKFWTRVFTPFARWYAEASGYRRMGLKYDDLSKYQ